jgi:hypothetical protein
MHDAKENPSSLFILDHQTLANIQNYSLANTALANLPPISTTCFQRHHSVHCCTGNVIQAMLIQNAGCALGVYGEDLG